MRRYFKEITLLFSVLTIIVNGAAEALPFNNISTAAISDKYHTLFTPAGYVFAIWGIIYIGWLAYSIYPYLNREQNHDWMLPAFPYYIVSAVANMLWLVLWHYEQLGLSVVVMLVLLFSLVQVYRKLEIGVYPASTKTKWMVHVPMSIYLGWISVATIANISAFLTQIEWNGFGISEATWAIILVVIATLLGCVMLLRRKDYAFAAVLVWALLGINSVISTTQPAQSTVIILSVVVLVVVGLYVFFRNKMR